MEGKYWVLVVFVVFACIEVAQSSFFNKKQEKSDDLKVESISLLLLFTVTQPIIFIFSYLVYGLAIPDLENTLTMLHWGWALLLFLLLDDMMQYWWHRLSHTYVPLYKLHRAHHDANYLSVRVVYRNNFFFYLMMPSIWFSAFLVYLGLGWFYAIFLVVKQTVIIGSHCEWKWDKPLYENKWTKDLMWIVERVISTPSTHSAHHGRFKTDPATQYKGNYGNLLFLWDIIFGTAKITREYPQEYGVEGLKQSNWREQLFWPFIKTKPKKQ